MQLPIKSDFIASDELEGDFAAAFPDSRNIQKPAGFTLPSESQMKMREVSEYVSACRLVLNRLRSDFCILEVNFNDRETSQKAADRLGRFCMDADSWGFDSLYRVAFGMQRLLLNSADRARESGFLETLNRGLTMLSTLVELCRSDFYWKLAVAEMLDCLSDAELNDGFHKGSNLDGAVSL